MLFYIMDYNRKPDDPTKRQDSPFLANNDSRISLGVVNSKPRMDGMSGGISVDASNTGYKQEDLEYALGEYYDQVMSLIGSSVQKHGGVSPALKTFEKAATNLDLLLKIIKDYEEDARKAFVIRVFEQDNVSTDILSYFYNDSDFMIRRAVGGHEKTPPETLSKMIEDESNFSMIGDEIASNPSAPKSLLTGLYKKMKDKQNTGHILKYSERITHGAIQKSLAKNPSTPEEILFDIFNESKTAMRGYSVQAELAQNPSLPLDLLKELGNGPSTLARSYIAINPLTPADLLEKLASDEDELVRMRVTMNPKIKPETLIRLSEDADTNVRAQVAYNTKDPKLLEKLSNDPTPFVRMKVAMNKATSTSTLEKLKNDKDLRDRRFGIQPRVPDQVNERKRYSLKFLF